MAIKKCPYCKGGKVIQTYLGVSDNADVLEEEEDCDECGGTGKVFSDKPLPIERKSDRDRNKRDLQKLKVRPRNVSL